MQGKSRRLARQLDWDRIEAELETVYRDGPGQPPLPTRLLVGLHYLTYTFDESDESVVERWLAAPASTAPSRCAAVW